MLCRIKHKIHYYSSESNKYIIVDDYITNTRYKFDLNGNLLESDNINEGESKMRDEIYLVTLTNGTVKHEYRIPAISEKTAIILAQAEAIKLCRGYDLVSVVCE